MKCFSIEEKDVVDSQRVAEPLGTDQIEERRSVGKVVRTLSSFIAAVFF